MRILFVNERCGYAGGIEQNVADTSEGLRARGHKCFLAYGSMTAQGDVEEYKRLFDGCYECADLGPRKGSESFERILLQAKPDVVYLHKFCELRPFAHTLSSVRTVRVIHDHDLCCPTGLKYYRISGNICTVKAGWRCWADGGFLARSLRSPAGFQFSSIAAKMREMRINAALDLLIVDSRFMRDELIQNGFVPSKVHVLPHIVRLPQCTPDAVPEEHNLLYVGQLIRGKGVDLLLRALAGLACEYHARIVGTGNLETKLKALASELGLAGRVNFEGWVPHEDLNRHYSWAKVIAVPSRWAEPYGMVGLEAMNHGRATVAFNVGGISDWLTDGETGLLVPAQDTKAFGQAIERILADHLLAAEMGKMARAGIENEFSFDKYLDEVERLLRT